MERNYNRKENGGSRKPAGRNFRKESYDRNFNNERRERQDGERRERRSFGKERFNSERRDSAENREAFRETAPRFRKRERIGENTHRESREYIRKDYYNPEARRETNTGPEKRDDRRERKEFRRTESPRPFRKIRIDRKTGRIFLKGGVRVPLTIIPALNSGKRSAQLKKRSFGKSIIVKRNNWLIYKRKRMKMYLSA